MNFYVWWFHFYQQYVILPTWKELLIFDIPFHYILVWQKKSLCSHLLNVSQVPFLSTSSCHEISIGPHSASCLVLVTLFWQQFSVQTSLKTLTLYAYPWPTSICSQLHEAQSTLHSFVAQFWFCTLVSCSSQWTVSSAQSRVSSLISPVMCSLLPPSCFCLKCLLTFFLCLFLVLFMLLWSSLWEQFSLPDVFLTLCRASDNTGVDAQFNSSKTYAGT